jgi:hypothetical protein
MGVVFTELSAYSKGLIDKLLTKPATPVTLGGAGTPPKTPDATGGG